MGGRHKVAEQIQRRVGRAAVLAGPHPPPPHRRENGQIQAEGPRRLTCVVKTPIRRQNRRVNSANESGATCIRPPTPSRRGYAPGGGRLRLGGAPGAASPRRQDPQKRASTPHRREAMQRGLPLVYIAETPPALRGSAEQDAVADRIRV
jgi:hypothetical protein